MRNAIWTFIGYTCGLIVAFFAVLGVFYFSMVAKGLGFFF